MSSTPKTNSGGLPCCSFLRDSSAGFQDNEINYLYGPTDTESILPLGVDMLSRSKALTATFNGPQLMSLAIEPLFFTMASALDTPCEVPFLSLYDLKKPRTLFEFALNNDELNKSLVTSTNQYIPEQPYLLLPGSIEVNKSIDQVLSLLHDLFTNDLTAVDYEFIQNECCYNGVFVCGSKYTDFTIRIYNNTDGSALLIEFQRLQRESCCFTFKHICDAVKTKLNSISENFSSLHVSPWVHDFSSFESASEATEEELIKSIEKLLLQISEGSEETQLEACRILCDLSDEAILRQQMANTDCIRSLAFFLKSDRLLLKQHAVLALAQLSECQECITTIIDSRVISTLMDIATDGPYNTAMMRRESARAIANVAAKKASDIMATVDKEIFRTWSSNVSQLCDSTVRERSLRARSYLQLCSV